MDSRKECLTTGLHGALFVLFSSLALAAEPLTKEEELRFLKEETVSIAARHEQPISQAPSNVYVITDEDIRQSGATDVPTILRRIPGMEVMQTTGADFNVSARGDNQLAANKMLVLVDGRSIYDDVQGQVFWKGIPVTLPEIKRIEVLKGPAGALYGFNAFDGVINIITKSPEEMKGTTLQFGGGEFGTITAAAIEAGTVGKLGYRLSAGRDQNNQWRNRDALAFRSHKFNVQTEYGLPGDSKLQVSGGLVDMNRFDGPTFQDVTFDTKPQQGYANVAYERPNFFIRSWWRENHIEGEIRSQPPLVNILRVLEANGSPVLSQTINTYDVEAQHALELGLRNRLTYGVNFRHNNISGNTVDSFSEENRLGVYLQNEWTATQNLTIVAAARYDLHTEINPTISPRLALVYTPVPDQTFRAGISVAYRPPTLAETHLLGQSVVTLPFPPPFNISTSTTRGSPNLNPEEIVSYEAGYQGWFLRHRLKVRTDLFLNHLSDLITFQSSDSGVFPVNGGEADIYGLEAGIEFLITSWLSGFANYAYEEIGGQSFTGRLRRGAPRDKVNAGLRAEFDNGFSGEAAIHYVGPVDYPPGDAFTAFAALGLIPQPVSRVDSYTLLNIRAGYRFWKEKAEVAVSVFNALNDRHKEHPLGDTIGSRVMGWLTMRF
jgi:iron complex outermembrane receptor protein